MNTKAFALLLAIVVLGGGAYYFLGTGVNDDLEEEADTNRSVTSGMRAEENAVVVPEQRPGNTVVGSMVYLAALGYLVIHEDKNGEPGAILGTSALLQAGENTNIPVTLSRASRDGETLHAMLHTDADANSSFDASIDIPVQSRLGGPIHGWFEITSSAGENVPVSI